MSTKLNAIANICLIAASAVVISDIAYSHLHKTTPLQALTVQKRAMRSSSPAEGEMLKLPDTSWSKTKSTLVIAIRRGCHYCEDSTPFYRLLAESLRHSPQVDSLVIAPGTVDSTRSYLDQHNLSAFQNVKSLKLSDVHVIGTPTIILVGSNGKVQRAWMGELESDREQDVLGYISKPQNQLLSRN